MAREIGTHITIRRPNGDIETVVRAGEYFTQLVKDKMIAATRAAGRGEILSFEDVHAAPSLDAQRRMLTASIQGALDTQRYQYDRAHDRQDARAEIIKAEHQPRIDAARAALAAFDAAHPEVVAALAAERQAAADRMERYG